MILLCLYRCSPPAKLQMSKEAVGEEHPTSAEKIKQKLLHNYLNNYLGFMQLIFRADA